MGSWAAGRALLGLGTALRRFSRAEGTGLRALRAGVRSREVPDEAGRGRASFFPSCSLFLFLFIGTWARSILRSQEVFVVRVFVAHSPPFSQLAVGGVRSFVCFVCSFKAKHLGLSAHAERSTHMSGRATSTRPCRRHAEGGGRSSACCAGHSSGIGREPPSCTPSSRSQRPQWQQGRSGATQASARRTSRTRAAVRPGAQGPQPMAIGE